MLRTIKSILTLSLLVLFSACDVPVDPEPPENTPNPSLSIVSPGANSTLSGIITFSANAENVELVEFFIGDSLLASVSASPYEVELNTRHFPNGINDLRAEARAAGGDSTLVEQIEVNFENYLAVIDATNTINTLNIFNNDRGFVFLSAPDGTILQMVELQPDDSIIKLGPPEVLPESGAPNSFSLTSLLYNEASDNLFAITYAGLEPWTTQLTSEFSYEGPPASDSTDIEIKLSNLPQSHPAYQISTPGKNYIVQKPDSASLNGIFRIQANSTDLIVHSFPPPGLFDEENPPLFYWETALINNDTLALNVMDDFSPMVKHTFNIPGGVVAASVLREYFISTEQNSYDNTTDIGPFIFEVDPRRQIYVPGTEYLYSTWMSGVSATNNNVYYTQMTKGSLPASFDILDYSIDFINKSVDNMTLQKSGTENPDVILLYRTYLSQGDAASYRWSVYLPDTTETFIYPRLGDSLDIATNYDRQSFSSNSDITTFVIDDLNADGYQAFLKEWFELFVVYTLTQHRVYGHTISTRSSTVKTHFFDFHSGGSNQLQYKMLNRRARKMILKTDR